MPPEIFRYTSGDSQYGPPMEASWPCAGGNVEIRVWPTSADETAASMKARFLAKIDQAELAHPYVH